MERLIEESFFISLLKKINLNYYLVKQRLIGIFVCSRTYELIRIIRVWFSYCFLGRVFKGALVFDISIPVQNSIVIRFIFKFFLKVKEGLKNYIRYGFLLKSREVIKSELYIRPVKVAGIIMLSVVSSEILFSCILNRKLGFIFWFVRVMLLFVGFCAAFSAAEWEEVKKTSFVLKGFN